jgi:glucan 1,3-beta-glucosidase
MTFNGCKTAIFMNWNWAWTFKSLKINNCGVGIDMSNGGSSQTVGSVLILDSKMTNTPKGVVTSYSGSSTPETGGTLVLDNVDFTGSSIAVARPDGSTVLAGGSVVSSWGQGNMYTPTGKHPHPIKLLSNSCKLTLNRLKPVLLLQDSCAGFTNWTYQTWSTPQRKICF